MRYISHAQLKEKMVLANPFYGPNFEIMLGRGVSLTPTYIRRIRELGYQGVYVRDSLSESLEPIDIVSIETRIETVMNARDLFKHAEKGAGSMVYLSRYNQEKIIMPVIESISSANPRIVDMFDLKPFEDYLHYHTANVVILSVLLGIEMGVSSAQLHDLGMAAFMHDVGNLFIPKSLLNKPGRLSSDEFNIVKSHSQMGFEYLRDHFDISIEACLGALQHHENFDGTGYPTGLKGDKISIYGRIIAATDVYDALTSRRPFRQPVYPAVAMDYMSANSGTMFDPAVIDALKGVIALYPTGCLVELDNGETGMVMKNFKEDLSRPKVRLFDDDEVLSDTVLDLYADPKYSDISVSEIIDW